MPGPPNTAPGEISTGHSRSSSRRRSARPTTGCPRSPDCAGWPPSWCSASTWAPWTCSAPPPGHRRWDLVFGQGASGVSFFFILSGFVLVWAARPGDSRRAFWQRRLAKIYPNHVITWALVIAITLAGGSAVSRKVALANLLLIHPWLLHGSYLYSINTVSWSLGCEAFFYLCFPLGLPLLRRMRPAVLAATALLLAAMLYELRC
ncbi:acyltransferase [Streptacidiphilus sp. 4-A2]|nr:acyltransferase [Streptacidiphilus sp. 4-A2]